MELHESGVWERESDRPIRRIQMPAPSRWPIVVAFGALLVAAGLATQWSLIPAGAFFLLAGVGGWILELRPARGETFIEVVEPEPMEHGIPRAPRVGEREPEQRRLHRTDYPSTTWRYSAGALGGGLGGVAMAVVALIYGVASGRGIWYPVNLLAGIVLPSFGSETLHQIEQFSAAGLLVGVGVHVVISLGVGLSFGLILPMMPGSPIVWAGIVAPAAWTAGVYALLFIADPPMARFVSWPWFIVSQFAYGIVMGLWIRRAEKVPARAAAIGPAHH